MEVSEARAADARASEEVTLCRREMDDIQEQYAARMASLKAAIEARSDTLARLKEQAALAAEAEEASDARVVRNRWGRNIRIQGT
jgi:hypothetical protein